MRYSLAVFDLDGTLLNTLGDLAVACNCALADHCFSGHDQDSYKLFVGDGRHKLIQRMVPVEYRENIAVLHSVSLAFDVYYAANGKKQTCPYPGIPEMLAAVKDAGIPTAVLSNKPHTFVPDLVEHYFPGLVDMALGQREGVPKKPDPTALWGLMKSFATDPAQCIYAGDSGVDMDTGRAAGAYTVGVTWGFRTKQELETHGAMYIVDKPAELTKIIVDIF